MTASLTDLAYDAIKLDIIRCRLRPGERVSEAKLTEATDAGKAAVRTALHRLTQEGLVIPVPRQGYLISPVTAQDVMDLFGVRLLLEPAAARMATGRVDQAQLRELDRLCHIGYDPSVPESVDRFQQANKAFHLLIAEAAGNPRLTRMLAGILDEMQRLYHLGLTAPNVDHPDHEQGHRHLVEAIESGDPDLAQRLAEEGIVEAQRSCLDVLLTLPSMRNVELSMDP